MKEIELTRGLKAFFDDADYEDLARYKWCYTSGYASRRNPGQKQNVHMYMHRQLCSPESGLYVAHKDGNRLNNQRSNLVVRSRTYISQQTATRAKSGYKGVHRSNGKWIAQICVGGKNKHLGRFIDGVDAARKYDEEARKVYGEFAYVNFKPGHPNYVEPKVERADAV